jgi:hypothetical protein
MSELLARHLRLVDQKNGDAVADRVDAAAAGAGERVFVGGKSELLAALGNGTDENVQELLEYHQR